MTPISIAGIMTIAASIAVGVTLTFVKSDPKALVVGIVGTILGAVLVLVGRRGGAARAPSPASEPVRFAAAFAKTPPPPPGMKTQAAMGIDLVQAEVGASTLAVRFTPDTSVAPMPGFADVYSRIAAGAIRGHFMVVGGPDRGRGVELTGSSVITVGRGSNHTLKLTDAGVSNDQCEFRAEDGRVYVRDLGSKNGTYLNNQRVERQALDNCDMITCGTTKILATLPG